MNKHLICEPTVGGECNVCGMGLSAHIFGKQHFL
jgi:hypothetical protein